MNARNINQTHNPKVEGFKSFPRNQNPFIINNFQDTSKRPARACYQTCSNCLRFQASCAVSTSVQLPRRDKSYPHCSIRAEALIFRMFSHITLNGICISEWPTGQQAAPRESLDRWVQNPTSFLMLVRAGLFHSTPGHGLRRRVPASPRPAPNSLPASETEAD